MSHNRRLLHRRGRVWYFRQRVPTALVAVVGRGEVMRSLRTADHREATRRAAVVEVGLARRWAALLARRGDAMRLGEHELERLPEEFERLVKEDRESRPMWRPTGQVPYGCPENLDPDEVEFTLHVADYWDQLEEEGAAREQTV